MCAITVTRTARAQLLQAGYTGNNMRAHGLFALQKGQIKKKSTEPLTVFQKPNQYFMRNPLFLITKSSLFKIQPYSFLQYSGGDDFFKDVAH